MNEMNKYNKMISENKEHKELDEIWTNVQGIHKLHNRLNGILQEQQDNWKHLIYAKGKYYQSLKEVQIEGRRNTEQRFEEYKIRQLLEKHMVSLDIGSNTGFFSITVAKYIKEANCVEVNPYLNRVGIEVAKFLKRNVIFHTCSFKRFETEKKFDIVMSYAADEVADRIEIISFEYYTDKICRLLKPNGLLFFESQAEDILMGKWNRKYEIIKTKFDIIFEKNIVSVYPVNAPARCFLIGRKK